MTDDLERDVRAMLQQRAQEMPGAQPVPPELARRVARRRTTKLALAGTGAAVVVAVVAAGVAAATASNTKHQRVITSIPTTVSRPRPTTPTTGTVRPTAPLVRPAAVIAGVGCPTSAVTAPSEIAAPRVGTREVAIADPAVAKRVRSYVGPRAGFATDAHALEPDVVLGPKGWSCRVYRSNGGGAIMYVYPPSAQGSFGPNDWAASEQYAGTEVRVVTAVLGHNPDIGLACAVLAGDPLVERWHETSGIQTPCAPPTGRTITKLAAGVYSFVDADGTHGLGVMRVRATTPQLDGDFGIVTCKLTGADASLCDAIIADYTTRYPGVVPGASPTHLGGVVTTTGVVGALRLAQSTEADVRAALGAPDKTARGSFGVGLPAYDVLGYECTSRSAPAPGFRVSGQHCDTVYFINTATKTLAAFETTSSKYTTARGTTIGMTPADAEQHEGKQLITHGCDNSSIQVGSFYQNGGAAGAALFIYVGPTTNDRVWLIAAESNVNPVGVLFC